MSFNLPPLTDKERERKAEAFMNLLDHQNVEKGPKKERVLTKEKTKSILLRVPISLMEDIKEISAITGISMNSICLDLLRPTAKKKLKELKD